MVDCGFAVEWLDVNGGYHIMACHDYACPHQPVTEHQVWSVEARRTGGDIWHFHGQFADQMEARMVFLRTNADHYSYIQRVQLCLWPVNHPVPLPD